MVLLCQHKIKELTSMIINQKNNFLNSIYFQNEEKFNFSETRKFKTKSDSEDSFEPDSDIEVINMINSEEKKDKDDIQ